MHGHRTTSSKVLGDPGVATPNTMTIAETIANWLFTKMGLDHDETWSDDHLDRDATVAQLDKRLFSKREIELITHGLYMLESACYGEELHYDAESELGGTPNPDEVRTLMDRF